MDAPSAPTGPTGRVALVFTDVEDSTALWERHGASFQPALERHEAILRAAAARWRGYEVKTEGDSFFLAFQQASDALAFCREAQAALRPMAEQSPRLRVRMGVHLGEPIVRPDPLTGRTDYFGPPVNRAARVAAAGHGGQILATEEIVHASPGRWRELGAVVLRGLPGATRIWQLDGEEFPPLRAEMVRTTNLLAPPEPMIGRQAELGALVAALDAGERLITLSGPGGGGKTRLGLAFAAAVAPRFGELWWADASPASDAEGIATAVAGAMGLPLGAEPEAQVGRALAGRGALLLVVDTLERAAEAAPLLLRWRAAAPSLTVLAISQRPLHLPGERAMRLDPLPEADAIALFCARAPGVSPGDPALSPLVRALDGLPLAIELAAARAALLGPEALLARLAHPLAALGGGRRDGPARHATLRAALDWSLALLSPADQAALAALSVFVGGARLDAAEAVLGPGLLDHLAALAEAGLLRVERGRVTLPGPVQAYAAERLTGPAREAAQRAHGRHYAGFGSFEALAALRSHGGQQAHEALTRELENLIAACTRALAAQDGEIAAATALAIWAVVDRLGPMSRGQPLLTAALPLGARVAELLSALGRAEFSRGRITVAEQHLRQGLAAVHDQPAVQGQIIRDLGAVCFYAGRLPEAEALLAQALDLACRHALLSLEGQVRVELATIAKERGELAVAKTQADAAIRAMQAAGDLFGEGPSTDRMGVLLAAIGEREAARRAYESALTLTRAAADRRGEASALSNLGVLLRDTGHAADSAEALRAAVQLCGGHGDQLGETIANANLGRALQELGDAPGAERALAAAVRSARALGAVRLEAHVLAYRASVRVEQGNPAAALEETARAMELLGGLTVPQTQAAIGLARVPALAALGRLDEAAAEAEGLRAQADRLGDLRVRAAAWVASARVARARDAPDAREIAEIAASLAARSGNPRLVSQVTGIQV